jgi:hypothetical protein
LQLLQKVRTFKIAPTTPGASEFLYPDNFLIYFYFDANYLLEDLASSASFVKSVN